MRDGYILDLRAEKILKASGELSVFGFIPKNVSQLTFWFHRGNDRKRREFRGLMLSLLAGFNEYILPLLRPYWC